jgi:hypothetical protein
VTDQSTSDTVGASSARCPWCSSPVSGDPVACPSCGATLREEAPAEIPGVTQIDPAATTVTRPAAQPRGLIGWLSGDYEPTDTADERASVGPPSEAVRQEMLRLEMEAIRAELAAEEAEAAAAAAAESEAVNDSGTA